MTEKTGTSVYAMGTHFVVACDKEFFEAQSVILATGGASYPATGSTGDGFKFARQLGHTVTEILPALVPLETEEDFLDTLDLVERVRYHNAFTFIYSPRKGTVAAKMEQIPYAIKSERIKRLIALQNKITLEISETYVGKIKEVLVEDAPKGGMLCGRTDCGRLVTFAGDKGMIGQFVNVRIEKNKASALIGEIVND